VNIRQHVPAFCDGFEKKTAQFDTLEELLAVPWIHSWTEDAPVERFSWSKPWDTPVPVLMAELANGEHWVVGFFRDCPDPGVLGLPKWAGPRTESLPKATPPSDPKHTS
jgi:hypothetical protein